VPPAKKKSHPTPPSPSSNTSPPSPSTPTTAAATAGTEVTLFGQSFPLQFLYSFLAHLHIVITPEPGNSPLTTANPRHFSVYWAQNSVLSMDLLCSFKPDVLLPLLKTFRKKHTLTAADLAPFKKQT